MESGGIKDKAMLILVSSVTLFSIKLLYNYFTSAKKTRVLQEISTESSECSYSDEANDPWSSNSGERAQRDVIDNTVASDSNSDDGFGYENKNNLIFGANDEIIAYAHVVDSDATSIGSYSLQPKRVSRRANANSRENNAKKFLSQLDKMRTKVLSNRLTLKDYKNKQKGAPWNQELISVNDASTFKNADSIFDESVRSDDEVQETKTLEEKFIKEKQRQQNSKNPKVSLKASPSNDHKPKRKRCKTSRKGKFHIDYEDLNRKDNYIFFEVLAVYANSYLSEGKKVVRKSKKAAKKQQP